MNYFTNVWQTHNKLMSICILCSPYNLFIAGIFFTKSYIFLYCGREQNWLLIDNTDMSAQPLKIIIFEISTIDRN